MDRSQLLNDVETANRIMLQGLQSGLWTAMPGIVTKVNLSAVTCEVQPAIQGTTEDEQGVVRNVNYPLLVDVPIVFPSAGGFLLTLPIAVGDEVLVVFASRCIDAWWQSGGSVNRPMEARMHDLSDGFALPGPFSQPKTTGLGAISSTGAQLRNKVGTSYVEIAADGKIKLVGSEIDITGNVVVTGTILASGEITGAGTPLHTHVHSGVIPGGGSTGPPVP